MGTYDLNDSDDEYDRVLSDFITEHECLFSSAIWVKEGGGLEMRVGHAGNITPDGHMAIAVGLISVLRAVVEECSKAKQIPAKRLYDLLIARLRMELQPSPRYD